MDEKFPGLECMSALWVNLRSLLDGIVKFQIKNNESVIRKGARLLIDAHDSFHLKNGCYSREKDDVLVENGCMEFYYQAFFIITEQILTLFKAGLNHCVCIIVLQQKHCSFLTRSHLVVLSE